MDALIHGMEDFGGSLCPDFRNPFRYVPSEAVKFAARLVIAHIESSGSLRRAFSEGKMLGVLTVSDPDGNCGFLAAFSGNVCGAQDGYFVPPIFDTNDPAVHFRQEEKRISLINYEIAALESSPEFVQSKAGLSRLVEEHRAEIERFASVCADRKKERDLRRLSGITAEEEASLIRESQFLKAEMRRMKEAFALSEKEFQHGLLRHEAEVAGLKRKRQKMSEDLQEWLFRQYVVYNALGERMSIHDIFREKGLVPPAGTGECAAPKLLQYAYAHGLTPLSMGEFWYGKSPSDEIRKSGNFYPSCSGKCGPLLGFMTKGLEIVGERQAGLDRVRIIYSDPWLIAAWKPSGMPSVPGKDGKVPLEEILCSYVRSEGIAERVFAIHRLDMDTKGVIVFALDADTQKKMQALFASRSVRKTYIAKLRHNPSDLRHSKGECGKISLPLAADFEDRPRQKVDFGCGKAAETEYEILDITDGEMTVLFRPLTGRTHQLRVHSAHPQGLGAPIAGDMLYGGTSGHGAADWQVGYMPCGDDGGLQLEAVSLEFVHPHTRKPLLLNNTGK